MRISGGVHRSRQLVSPRGSSTRPTSDRVREALFSILDSRGAIAGARVIDFYAGTGALGLEALSRGAAHATFVERAPRAIAVLRKNLDTTGFTGRATIVRADAVAFLSGPVSADIAFCDPPFADVAAHGAVLAKVAAPGRLVIARALRKHLPEIPPTLRIARRKEIGEETLLLLQYSESASAGG